MDHIALLPETIHLLTAIPYKVIKPSQEPGKPLDRELLLQLSWQTDGRERGCVASSCSTATQPGLIVA